MQKEAGRELQENSRGEICHFEENIPQSLEQQENMEDEISPDPNPQAALMWMLGLGRRVDSEKMEWK